MEHYLIDFENVRSEALKNLCELKDGDSIAIFYSDMCKNINLETLDILTNANVRIVCFKVATGTKNALDFQLSSYLGYLIGNAEENGNFHIVTRDKGFDCLHKFWKKNGVSVDRMEPVKQPAPVEKPPEPKPETKPKKKKKSKVDPENLATLEEVKLYLSQGDEPEKILEIFNNYKSRVAISNGISKEFKDSKRAGAIYQKLKPLLKAKNKS